MKPVRIFGAINIVILTATLIGCGGSSSPMPPSPPADFILAVSPQKLFVPIGAGSGSVQVSIQAVNNFTQSVSVSMSGLPAGVTTSPASPFMVTPGSNQTVTFTAANGSLPSVSNVTVSGSAGSLSHNSTLAVSIAKPSFAYVPTGNAPSNPPYNLTGFAVDANTGAVSQVPGDPVSLAGASYDLAVASEPNSSFVYLLFLDNTQSVYTLNGYSVDPATGVLTALQTFSYPYASAASAVVVHPSEKFLYVVQSPCTLIYTIDPATGNLTQSSCATVPGRSLAMTPSGQFAYSIAGDYIASNMYIYTVDQDTGALTQIQSFDSSGGASFAGLPYTDPFGRALYSLLTPVPGIGGVCSGIDIWTIDPNTGSLTPVPTSFDPLCEPLSMTFDLTGNFAYVTSQRTENSTDQGIYGGVIDPLTGNLTTVAGSPFTASAAASFGAVEVTQGKFLLEVINGNPDLQLVPFSIDPTTGALTLVSGASGTLPSASANVQKMVVVAPPAPAN
jgi:hypothetical protein